VPSPDSNRPSLYTVLGVQKGIDAEGLKKAYRKLAREAHPDKAAGDAGAEARFKSINRAYEVLSDPKRRALYDEFGDASLRTGFDPQKARAKAHDAGIRVVRVNVRGIDNGIPEPAPSNGLDMLNSLIGRRRKNGVRGADYEAEVAIDFAEAVRGTQRVLQGLPGALSLKVNIPRGVADGSRIRIPNEGAASMGDGPNGDLYLKVKVGSHPHFHREGNDLHLRLPVTLREAYFGAKIVLPTADGNVRVKIPPSSQTGDVLRIKHKGITPENGLPGDLLVHVMVQAPTATSATVAKLVEQLAEHQAGDPRSGVSL
jgi:curved DNA-binding protein